MTSVHSLNDWWIASTRAFEQLLTSSPNAEDAAKRMLERSARRLASADVADCQGELFSTICVALAALCRLERVLPSDAHWQTAVEEAPPQATFGLRDRAVQALLRGGAVARSAQDAPGAGRRELARRLAVHYLMRFLVAYARRCDSAADPAIQQFRSLLAPARESG